MINMLVPAATTHANERVFRALTSWSPFVRAFVRRLGFTDSGTVQGLIPPQRTRCTTDAEALRQQGHVCS
jgi:hypothetical protein